MNRRTALKKSGWTMTLSLTPGLITSILSSCTPSQTTNIPNLEVLSSDEYLILHKLIDRMLPETETPGAINAGVMSVLDGVLKNCFSSDTINTMKAGLKSLFSETGEKVFNWSNEEADAFLTEKLKNASIDDEDAGILRNIRNLAVDIYFKTEIGLKSNFDYKPVPGKYSGCIDFQPGDKVWISSY